jgi:hypothetical protein
VKRTGHEKPPPLTYQFTITIIKKDGATPSDQVLPVRALNIRVLQRICSKKQCIRYPRIWSKHQNNKQ